MFQKFLGVGVTLIAAAQLWALPPVALQISADSPGSAKIDKKAVGLTKALSFSCAEDKYFTAKARLPLGENFTFAAWVNPDGIPAGIGKFVAIGQKDKQVTLGYNQEKRFEFEFKLKDGTLGRTWTYPLPSDKWYFITGVCDAANGETKFYVNGRMHHLNKLSAAPAPLAADFVIGCADPGQSKAFWYNGLVNDIRVYNGALTEKEIQDLFQSESAKYPVQPVPESIFGLKQDAGGGFVLLPPYADNAVSERRKADLKKSIPADLKQYRQEIAEIKARIDKSLGSWECIQKERINKRAEIVQNLCNFIETNVNRNDVSGLLYAASGVQDLKHFLTYFRLEEEYLAKFPRLADGSNAGNQPTIFNVKDFGAVGDGVTDDYAAFAKAVEAMKALNGKPSILQIPAGTYFFNTFAPAENTPAAPGGCNLRIANLENAIIEGENPERTKFIFGRFRAAGLFLYRSKNVLVRNLSLQYQKTPFCQGTVLAVDVPNGTIDLRHDSGTLTPDDPSFKENPRFQCCTAYTADGNLVRTQFITFNDKRADDLGGGKYRIYMDKRYSIEHVPVGVKFVIPNREGEYPCFPFGENTLCTAENIYIRNSRSAAFQTWGDWWGTWTKFKLFPLPGMYLSSNADALISSNGTYMSYCEVKNPGDDCFNAFEGGLDITKADGNQAIYPVPPGKYAPGDMLLMISSATGQILAQSIIKDNRGRWEGQSVTTLEEPLPNTVSSRQKGGLKVLTPVQEDLVSRYLIRYEESLDTVYHPHQWGMGTVASNNFYAHARAGINIQSSNSLVENNVFENIPMGAAIAFSCLIGAKEGPAPYNVIARNNKIEDVYYGVRTHSFVQNMDVARCAPIRDIVFENNELKDTTFIFVLRNLGESSFRNNVFTGKPFNSFGEKNNQILVERCAQFSLDGNTLQGRPLQKSDLQISESASSIQIK